MERKTSFAFNPSNLTYFSGNKYGNDYFDLETIPLSASQGYFNDLGDLDTARSNEEVAISSWALKLLEGTDNNVNLTVSNDVQILSSSVDPTNKVILFKDADNISRLMVQWITNCPEGEEVGVIEGTAASGEVFREKLIVYPLKSFAYHSSGYAKDWDDFAYSVIQQVKAGVTVNNIYVKGTVPFQIVQAIIFRECTYNDRTLYRYEPFANMKYGYMGEDYKKFNEIVSELELASDQTIYQWLEANWYEPYNKYDKLLWFKAPAVKYLDLKNCYDDTKAKKYVELYLDYGYCVSDFWYAKLKEGLKEIEMKLYDPTLSFETEIWPHINVITLKDGTKIDVNSLDTADDLYTITFTKPEDATQDNRWDKRWEGKEDGEFNESFESNIHKIASYIREGKLMFNQDPILVLKTYLELCIKYREEANKWFKKQGSYDPRVDKPKPFKAQLDVYASYGPMQVMFSTAWDFGYKNHPKNEKNPLSYYTVSIPYGVYHLVKNKYKDSGVINNWRTDWNNAIKTYNGYDIEYMKQVREYEKKYYPISME